MLEVLYITQTYGFGCDERAMELSEASIPYIHSSSIRVSKAPTAVPHADFMQQHVVEIWTRNDWCPGGGVHSGRPRGKGMGPHWNVPLPLALMPHSHANRRHPRHTLTLDGSWRPVRTPSLVRSSSFDCVCREIILCVFRLTLRQLVLALRRDLLDLPPVR